MDLNVNTSLEDLSEGIVYYKVQNLVSLLKESGLDGERLSELERDLQERADYCSSLIPGYVPREHFVRLLEGKQHEEDLTFDHLLKTKKCFDMVLDYCRNHDNGNHDN